MAFIEKTAFEARITNNALNTLANVAGLYQADDVAADCSAGLLVVRGAQTPAEGFTGMVNENTWYMEAASEDVTGNDVILACNTYDVKMIEGYKIGSQTLGLGVPAGRYGNFTVIDFDGQSVYRFGEGNLSGALGTNKFFTIADGLLVPTASAPTTKGAIYFALRGTGNFIEGASESFGYVDVVACKPVV